MKKITADDIPLAIARRITHRTISQQDHVGSASFMPTGLISSLPDAVVVDMLTYIRSLK